MNIIEELRKALYGIAYVKLYIDTLESIFLCPLLTQLPKGCKNRSGVKRRDNMTAGQTKADV